MGDEVNWIDDNINSVVQGDCLEILKELPDNSVDLIVTDPPYDDDTHKGGKFTGAIEFGNVDFDSIDIIPTIYDFLRIAKKWVVIFVPIETLGSIKKHYPCEYIRGGIWDRIVNSPQISGDRPAQAVEGIAILHNGGRKIWNGGGRAGIWRAMVERGMKQHRTQKPISLMVGLVSDFSQSSDLILDPFAGSGTTLVAAKQLGRRYIGIEIEPKYVEIARTRLAQEVLAL